VDNDGEKILWHAPDDAAGPARRKSFSLLRTKSGASDDGHAHESVHEVKSIPISSIIDIVEGNKWLTI
jgi:hypothetical protein